MPSADGGSPPLGDARRDSRTSGFYGWFVVVLLMIAFTLSMADRMVLSLLVTPLKTTHGLSDVQISLLQGLAFTIFYVGCGIPLGGVADRRSRTRMISWCILLWSLVTILCAFTRSFAELFLSRLGVGIGEAGLSPAANSLISDYFPPNRLSSPIAVYSAGSLLGPALAMIGGGLLVDHLMQLGMIDLPFIGRWPAWQMTFVFAGLPGIALALVFRFIREPARHGRSQAGLGGIGEVMAYIWINRAFLLPHSIGAALSALCWLAQSFWLPTFMVRAHGLSPGVAGTYYGVIALVSGVAGLIAAAWMADTLSRRGMTGSHIAIPLWSALAAVVPLAGATLTRDMTWFLVLTSIGTFFSGSILPLTPVALQIFVPNEKRGQVFAFYLVCVSVMGYAVGPFAVAFVTEHVFADQGKLGLSLALVAAVTLPLAALCLSLSLARFRAARPNETVMNGMGGEGR